MVIRVAAFLIFAAFFAYISIWRLMRRVGARRLAREHGFEWLGEELVDGLWLRGTSLALAAKHGQILNSIAGKLNGVDFSAFDVRYMLDNRRQVTHTVVAFRNEGPLRCSDTPSLGQKDLHIELAGSWLICYAGWSRVEAKNLLAW